MPCHILHNKTSLSTCDAAEWKPWDVPAGHKVGLYVRAVQHHLTLESEPAAQWQCMCVQVEVIEEQEVEQKQQNATQVPKK